MSVKIKVVNSPAMEVLVHVDHPEWRQYLYY